MRAASQEQRVDRSGFALADVCAVCLQPGLGAGAAKVAQLHEEATGRVELAGLAGVTQLATRYSYGQLKALLQGNVCALEDRQGIRVVRGITTEGEAFAQITTRRIVDYAKAGIRQVANPFVGRLAPGSPEPQAHEHLGLRWVPPAGLSAMDLAPADLPVVAMLTASGP